MRRGSQPSHSCSHLVAKSARKEANPLEQSGVASGDTTPCRMAGVITSTRIDPAILHGVVSPDGTRPKSSMRRTPSHFLRHTFV